VRLANWTSCEHFKNVRHFARETPYQNCVSPLALLKQFVTLTGRKIRYLKIDGAKESQCDEIKEYCGENDVVLQLVVTYNHTVQARVESAIGCIKQHS